MIVHTREPVRYFRELGFNKGVAGLTLIAGTVMTGLFGPPFLLEAIWRGVDEAMSDSTASRLADVYTYILTLTGIQALILPALVGMRRRGMRDYGRALLCMPLYYALVSAATWVALYELIVRPFHWHKTAHGRARPQAAARIAGPAGREGRAWTVRASGSSGA